MGQGLGTARRKVRGGKLLEVRLVHDGTVVTSVWITGDFFVHPEEGLATMERAILGVPIAVSERELTMRLEETAVRQGVSLIGFSPSDLAAMIKEALR